MIGDDLTDDERAALERLFDRPALERLWAAATAKLERYGDVRGSVHLDQPDEAERRAVADLLGLKAVPPADRPLRVRLVDLDRILRRSRFAVGLTEALALHRGALRDLPAERLAEAEHWRRFWEQARRHPVILNHSELGPWLEDIESAGLYRRLAGRGSEDSADLLGRILAVLAYLLGDDDRSVTLAPLRDVVAPAPLRDVVAPAPLRGVVALAPLRGDGVRLPVLASRVLGDSHALDAGHRVPALVLRALARIHRRPIPLLAAERRELWALAGVVCDDLSCDVLVLGLAPAGDGLLHCTLREHAAAGEPMRITLRQLANSAPVRLPAAARVFACENPAVISVAADRLGERSPPLVCLAGQPDTAALVLLRSLVEGGAELHYHGDFDWGGLRIANVLSRAVPFRPWRFTAADYLSAARGAEHADLVGNPPFVPLRGDVPLVPLRGNSVDAAWDHELCRAMKAQGVAVEEEAVIEDLLIDLERRCF